MIACRQSLDFEALFLQILKDKSLLKLPEVLFEYPIGLMQKSGDLEIGQQGRKPQTKQTITRIQSSFVVFSSEGGIMNVAMLQALKIKYLNSLTWIIGMLFSLDHLLTKSKKPITEHQISADVFLLSQFEKRRDSLASSLFEIS